MWIGDMVKGENFLHAARILAACAISYGGSRLIGLHEGYWALITAVAVTHPALDDTLAAGRTRILGTLVGALAGLVIVEFAQLGASSLLLFWVAMIPLAFLTAVRPDFRLSCATLVIVVLVPSTSAPFARPIGRVLEILLGTVASIAVLAVVPPRSESSPK
jgi:uncharacterized membrane protein YccC